MKAILINDDKSLSWSEVGALPMGERDVLIKVACAGLNRADLMQRDGDYPPPEGCPEWMGLEVSGVIEDMGEVAAKESGFSKGDRVCALLGGGGYAEYVSTDYSMVIPVPEEYSMIQAAAIPEAFATAYLNLFIEGGLKEGNTLLMHAGASGLAGVVIPMAKAFGVRVITTVRSTEFVEKVKPLGADIIVDSSTEDIADVMKRELDAGRPVDVAIDCLGGKGMGNCLQYMQRYGRWIMIATLAGDLTEINMKTVYVRNVRIVGSTLRSRHPSVKAEILSKIATEVYPKIKTHGLYPSIYKTLPITEADEAHNILLRGENSGKVILIVDESLL